MYTESGQPDKERHLLDSRNPRYYELALYFAAAKAKEEEFHWENFIDNLSFICDKYASHIKSNNISNLDK